MSHMCRWDCIFPVYTCYIQWHPPPPHNVMVHLLMQLHCILFHWEVCINIVEYFTINIVEYLTYSVFQVISNGICLLSLTHSFSTLFHFIWCLLLFGQYFHTCTWIQLILEKPKYVLYSTFFCIFYNF